MKGWVMSGLALISLSALGAPDEFALGPVASKTDLRMMVRRDIVARCCRLLEDAAKKREAAFASGEWEKWRQDIREKVNAALGLPAFGASAPPLNVRPISRYEQSGYVIENVLFESFPGWDVNASVFLPDASAYPPPWPGIVVPVGHSGKQMESYQLPAQLFARLGYAAVLFDPPGMAGEKQGRNDHFTDGVRCYLCGYSSNRYFVLDALRCVDYLASRPDVDMRNGVGMTGVSGGGTTTMFAALLDDRIRAIGPSCCAVPNARHPIRDAYAPCAETLAPNRFADGYDDIDVLAAAIPTPVLLMAGAADEVFTEAMSEAIATEVKRDFTRAGHADRFDFFKDPGGHAYTTGMALAFVRWMDRWVRGTPDRALETPEKLEMVAPELLQCHPRREMDIYTANRDWARNLRKDRKETVAPETVRALVDAPMKTAAPRAETGPATLAWVHNLQEILIESEPGIELPATFLYPSKQGWRGPAVLYFDDRGRWTDLRSNGSLAAMAGFIGRDEQSLAVMTVDLRGWGDSVPADLPYEIAGWGARDRWMAYVSAALGDPIFAMRVRDGLASLAYLRSRSEIEPSRIAIGGRGMGGVVALHVALMDGNLAGVFSVEALAAFDMLVESPEYRWSQEDFFCGVLCHYDIPALVRSLKIPVLMASPLDAMKTPLAADAARALFGETAAETNDAVRFVRQLFGKE
ncbi:MAG TPA: acetylxylan esterase [Candidatus Hydrogenedentes bacterium]|nr:acetylxylan esterase [Candidatus Hydrogenedentota bacterium]